MQRHNCTCDPTDVDGAENCALQLPDHGQPLLPYLVQQTPRSTIAVGYLRAGSCAMPSTLHAIDRLSLHRTQTAPNPAQPHAARHPPGQRPGPGAIVGMHNKVHTGEGAATEPAAPSWCPFLARDAAPP